MQTCTHKGDTDGDFFDRIGKIPIVVKLINWKVEQLHRVVNFAAFDQVCMV
jgi:hypothetical protein